MAAAPGCFRDCEKVRSKTWARDQACIEKEAQHLCLPAARAGTDSSRWALLQMDNEGTLSQFRDHYCVSIKKSYSGVQLCYCSFGDSLGCLGQEERMARLPLAWGSWNGKARCWGGGGMTTPELQSSYKKQISSNKRQRRAAWQTLGRTRVGWCNPPGV